MPKLTNRFLCSLGPQNAGQVVRDEGSLFGRVRIRTDNTVAIPFYYRYRYAGKLRDYSCGTWPNENLAQIRSKRDAARITAGTGVDPCAHKKLSKFQRQEALEAALADMERKRAENFTIADMFNDWLRDGVRRADGNAQIERTFKADVLPALGKRPVREVTEHDIRAVLRALVARGTNRSAVMMRNNLTQMFAWARKRQPWRKLLVEGDPMDLIEIRKIVDRDYDFTNQRTRVLSHDEIRELDRIMRGMRERYEQAHDRRMVSHPLEKTTECAIWIMLSTLCRVGELLMARWEHVDFDAGLWYVPRENTKARLGQLDVFLSPFSLAQFRTLHTVTGYSPWCFPSPYYDTHVSIQSITKQLGDRQTRFKKSLDGSMRKPMAKRCHDDSLVLGDGKRGAWTAHDLRRTGATMMQALGVSLDVIDRCQNHVLPGSRVRRHYLHYDYENEKRGAWKILGKQLSLILGLNMDSDG